MTTLCLGEALVDLICHKHVGSIADADTFVPHFGGATANVAVAAARSGAAVQLAGGAGDDGWGDWLHDRLRAEGVGLTWFEHVEGSQTSLAFVTVAPDGEPTFSIYGESIESTVTAIADVVGEAVEACDALFVSTNSMVGAEEQRLTLAAREQCLEQGKPFLFDPNLRLRRWTSAHKAAAAARACLPGAFLVKCNRDEARLITGEEEPEAAAQGLLAAGVQHVVITLGADGAMLRDRKGFRRDVAGRPVEVVDTTGAGDAFMGVLVAKLASTDFYPAAIPAALPDAVEEGARCCERWGALPAPE